MPNQTFQLNPFIPLAAGIGRINNHIPQQNQNQKTKMETDPNNDPLGLNVDLSAVDTSYPVAEAGVHHCTVKSLEVVPKKDDPTKRNILVQFALSEPVSEAGKPDKQVNAGYTFRNYMPLQQSDNANAPDFRVGLAKFIDAVFGTTEADRPATFPAPAEFIGRPVRVVVKVDDDPQWGSRNSVGNVLPVE